MIVGLSISNFKGIRALRDLELSAFHVLVGPNGAGKTTLLDAIDFVRDCLVVGPAAAVESRDVADFNDLTWMRKGGAVEIGLWLDLGDWNPALADYLIKYQLAIRQDAGLGVCVASESLERYSKAWLRPGTRFEFAAPFKPKRILGKTTKGTDYYSREKGTYQDSFNFGLEKLTLALTPPDDERYPTGNAVRRVLMQGVRYVQLDSRAMRLPCPATRGSDLDLDGSNLARAVGAALGVNGGAHPLWCRPGTALMRWIEHLQYALPDLVSIGWDRRQADNAEFLMLRYRNGLEVPSWLLSDGTLRMLALTLPAFIQQQPAIFMVEEPENGVHPKALEVILRSLSSIPQSQMLLATHSPYLVQQCGVEPLLCLSSGDDGTHVVRGADHPLLQRWDGTPELGVVFASGLLG